MNVSQEFREGLLAAIPSLRAFAFSLIGRGDRADDLVQETLIKAWAHHASFQPGTNLRAWLYTILRNEFYSQMRKKGREVEDVDGAYSRNVGVHPDQHGHLDMADMHVALGQLPPDQREALLLVAASGFSYEEAADDLRRCHGHDQEPGQPGAEPPCRNPEGLRRRRVRAGCHRRKRPSPAPRPESNRRLDRGAPLVAR